MNEVKYNVTSTSAVVYNDNNVSSTIIDLSELDKDATIEDARHLPNMTINVDADKKNLESYNFVNNPDHYMHYDMSTYDMMIKIWGKYETMIWCKLTAWKYRQRMGTKPGESVQRDLDKEKWYLEKYHMLKEELETKKTL